MIDCKSTYYVEIMLGLRGAVCRLWLDMWSKVRYI